MTIQHGEGRPRQTKVQYSVAVASDSNSKDKPATAVFPSQKGLETAWTMGATVAMGQHPYESLADLIDIELAQISEHL